MQDIALKQNANKALIVFYTSLSGIACLVIFLLEIHEDISLLRSMFLYLILLLGYSWTIFKISPASCCFVIESAVLQENEIWQVTCSNGQSYQATIAKRSVLVGRLALLEFHFSGLKLLFVLWCTKDNEIIYRRFSRWWHSAKEKNKISQAN